MVDSVLRVQGYTVSSSPAGEGRWSIEPRFTWLEEALEEAWAGARHPGVEMGVLAEAHGDSTRVTVGARAICKVPPVPDGPESLEQMAEMLHATMLIGRRRGRDGPPGGRRAGRDTAGQGRCGAQEAATGVRE